VLAVAESLTGEVLTKRREPIAGAEVIVHTESGVRHAVTNKDGVYTITELAAGPARVRVRAKGHAPNGPNGKDVTIEEKRGRRPTEVPRIELAEEGIVEGIVVDMKGDPVPGARVGKDSVPTYLPVGQPLVGMALCDAKGRFRLAELAEGSVVLEAYAADIGRAKKEKVRVSAGRTTEGVKIVLALDAVQPSEPLATGGVAVTLGETAAGLEGPEVVIVAVSEGSDAERGGLAAGDVVVEVAGAHPKSIVDARSRLSGPVHDDVVVKVKRGERVLTLRIAREQVRR